VFGPSARKISPTLSQIEKSSKVEYIRVDEKGNVATFVEVVDGQQKTATFTIPRDEQISFLGFERYCLFLRFLFEGIERPGNPLMRGLQKEVIREYASAPVARNLIIKEYAENRAVDGKFSEAFVNEPLVKTHQRNGWSPIEYVEWIPVASKAIVSKYKAWLKAFDQGTLVSPLAE
jgi:hypothetical protein